MKNPKDLKIIKALIKKNKILLEKKYKVRTLGIFGSYARGDFRKNSDIDILAEFYETPDFFEFMRLEAFLKKMLGVNVDLVTRNALKPLIKKEILKETVYI
ncbi:MAG: nucleotidyltransferase family protein [Candidatus Omnitrophica bacterium]|nr:nucleotidyltransferase family protein [Candidatus Omnitrophota bacterium]